MGAMKQGAAPTYHDAVKLAKEMGGTPWPMLQVLQRFFRIGEKDAAVLLERMRRDGIA